MFSWLTRTYHLFFCTYHIPQREKQPLQHFIYILVIIWNIEWIIFFFYIAPTVNKPTLFLPTHFSLLLALSFIYWTFLWGNLNWRRTQFGFFTRGERKLWAKSLAAFWVVELVTIFAFVCIYFWMSWGPFVLLAHKFRPTKSGLVAEIILYTYMFYIIYILKIISKWNTHHSQLLGTFLVLILVSNLIWHDILIILFRNNLSAKTTGKWRHVSAASVVYALSNEWWAQHTLPSRSIFGWNTCFADLIQNCTPAQRLLPWTTIMYEQRLHLTLHQSAHRIGLPTSAYFHNFKYSSLHLPYPRRTGFIPKRFTMWQILVFLKIWHHLLMLIWWNLMVFRLRVRQQNSYNWLYACGFNTYCCFLIAVAIYTINLVPTFETFWRFRKYTLNIHKLLLLIEDYFNLYEENIYPNSLDYKKTFLFMINGRT